ncbi:hypothetical protein SNEBB_010473 [Seison nebaliae]|nr:hypothetical protein SNEBB_010473 [Seison nebaliae]
MDKIGESVYNFFMYDLQTIRYYCLRRWVLNDIPEKFYDFVSFKHKKDEEFTVRRMMVESGKGVLLGSSGFGMIYTLHRYQLKWKMHPAAMKAVKFGFLPGIVFGVSYGLLVPVVDKIRSHPNDELTHAISSGAAAYLASYPIKKYRVNKGIIIAGTVGIIFGVKRYFELEKRLKLLRPTIGMHQFGMNNSKSYRCNLPELEVEKTDIPSSIIDVIASK